MMVGASSKNLYAYTAAGISVSKNQGASWTALALDKSVDYLPTIISLCALPAFALPRTWNISC